MSNLSKKTPIAVEILCTTAFMRYAVTGFHLLSTQEVVTSAVVHRLTMQTLPNAVSGTKWSPTVADALHPNNICDWRFPSVDC